MKPPSDRHAMVDIAKGIAILLVVYGHCVRGLISAGAIALPSVLVGVDYVVYTFHMPIFFLASGLFFRHSAAKPAGVFWSTRFRTMVYPYVLWSFLQGGLQIALAGSGAINSGIPRDSLYGILWSPISPFWFLYALFLSNVAAMALVRMRSELLVAVAALAFAASMALPPSVVGYVTYGFLYFTIGMLVRDRGWLKQVPSSWRAVAMLTAAFLATAAACAMLDVPDRLPVPAALLGMTLTLSLAKALSTSAATETASKALDLIGKCSMSIFVMHVTLLAMTRTVLLHHMHVTSTAALILVETVVAVLVPMAVQLVLVRLGLNDLAGLPASAMKHRKSTSPRGRRTAIVETGS